MARAYRKKLRNCGFWLVACDRSQWRGSRLSFPRWKGLPFRWQCGNVLRPTSTKPRIHYYYHRKAKLRWCDGRAGCFRVGCHGNALGQPRGAAWNIHPLASFPRFSLLPPTFAAPLAPLSSRAQPALSLSRRAPSFRLWSSFSSHGYFIPLRLGFDSHLISPSLRLPLLLLAPLPILLFSSQPPLLLLLLLLLSLPRHVSLGIVASRTGQTLLLPPTSFPRLRYSV